jgi:hypothetical protein
MIDRQKSFSSLYRDSQVQILHEWYFHMHICSHQHDTSQNGNMEVESPKLVAGYPEASWEAIPSSGAATLALFSWHHHVGKIGCFLCTHIFVHHELPKIQRAFWHEDRLVLSLWSSMRHCNDWNQPICIDNWLMAADMHFHVNKLIIPLLYCSIYQYIDTSLHPGS